MSSWVRRTLGAAAIAAAMTTVAGSVASAQTQYPNVRLNGRYQEQFYYFNNEPYAAAVGPKDNFFSRRARIEARGNITENISVFIQPSFEGGRVQNVTTTCRPIVVPATGATITPNCTSTTTGGIRLRDAWIDLRFTPEKARTAVYFRAGQEKRPFDRYELISSNNLPSIERGAGRGLPFRASNDVFTANGFVSHDVGAHMRSETKLDEAGLRKVVVTAGVYNGQGESAPDVNNSKSFGFRATAGIWSKLDIGGAYYTHDYIQAATTTTAIDSTAHNWAYEGSFQWQKPGDAGLFVLGEYLFGQDATAAKNKIRGIQALAAYNVRLSSPTSFLYAIEPAFRIDFADPNTAVANDRITTITGGINLYFASRAIFRVAYERQQIQGNLTPSVSGVRSQMQVYF
jgi:hypothetical protein